MKYNLLFFLMMFIDLVFSQPLSTEQNQLAHRRYWFYRTRFINDFTKLGAAQGDCICFAERNYESSDNRRCKIGPDQIDIMNQYLSALALEYKILSRANQSTQETLREIYYILEMYNRIDEEADQFWSATPPSSDLISRFSNRRNGFMLREDMPRKYFHPQYNNNNYKHFNYALKEYNNSFPYTQWSYSGLPMVDTLNDDNKYSNYKPFLDNPGEEPLEELPLVLDKYLSMFNAFMFLIKYIPNNISYIENGQTMLFSDGVADIKTEVRNITNRCKSYIKGNTFGNNATNWVLDYPNGNQITDGWHMFVYSWPVAKMICYINGGYPWTWPCNNDQDLVSSAAGFLSYNVLYLNPIPPQTPTLGSTDAAVFLGNVQAGSNAPVFLPVPVGGGYLPVPIPVWIAMDLNASINSVEWAELLRKVLHQSGGLMKQKSVFADPISQAPCIGPYNFGINDLATYEWRSQDRLEHPNNRNGGAPEGNYPGVDFMLLHNLYYEYLNQEDDGPGPAESGAYKNAYNLMDNYDEQIWPRQIITNPGGGNQFNQNGLGQNITIGVDANIVVINNPPGPGGPVFTVKQPARIKLFQNLESRAQIYASASPAAPTNTIPSKVEYRAGKEISLMPETPGGVPGFEVKLGSDFTAYIQRYVCVNKDTDPLLMKQNPNDENNRYNDYENDDMNTEVPIHYVQGPKSDSDLYPYDNENEEVYSTENTVDVQNALVEQYNIANDNNNQNQITSLENIAAKQRFIALPNPNNGVFKVYANRIADNEVFELSIYDMKGQMILNYKNLKDNVSLEIDLSNNSEGIYMLHLNSSLGGKLIKKVTVIK